MLPGDNASAIHICKIGILRQTPDAAPHNQKPWMYILDDSQELLQPGNTQIDGLIVWEKAEFFISIPLEAMASVIRPGGSLLVIEPPDALGDRSRSVAQHAYEDERGFFKKVEFGTISNASVLNLQNLIENGIVMSSQPHDLTMSSPPELDRDVVVTMKGVDNGTTLDNTSSSSQTTTIPVIDENNIQEDDPQNTLYLLIRTQNECTKSLSAYCKLPKPHPSFINSWREQHPFLLDLIAGRQEILEEVNTIQSWVKWPEEHLYGDSVNTDCKVFPFCTCIPSDNVKNFKWIERCCAACPKTAEMLRNIGPLRSALFSRLGANTSISSHRGWSVVANHVLRCLVPILLPSPSSCGIWVEGERRILEEGEIIVFDDSKLHKAYNADPLTERIILILDIERPDNIRIGCSRGGVTPELANLLETFT